MFLNTLKGATAFGAVVLLAGLAANATTVSRSGERPDAQRVHPAVVTPGAEQVLIEGGTLAANYYGNVADIVGVPIACATPGFKRVCATETALPATAVKNPQVLYAAVGTGGAQYDFVTQLSGNKEKTASTYPLFADAFDAYSNVAPFGYGGWAGTASSATAEDSIDAGAGDAPLPLGPAEGTAFVPAGFTIYSDSIAAYDGGGDTTGAGFNANRGPAKVAPILGTSVRFIFNTTGLTYTAPLELTQDDLCGIFTGKFTNYNQTAANTQLGGVSQAITIIHRSDGSGTTFLTSYDLSEMCSATNPFKGTGEIKGAQYWNIKKFTQGVGTDSGVLSSTGVVPTDSTAPEVVWPATSLGASKSSGVIDAVAYGLEISTSGVYDGNSCTAAGPVTPGDTCSNPAGYVGYVTPSDTLGASTDEFAIENYTGAYVQATGGSSGTTETALKGTSSSHPNPPGYPADNSTNVLYFPFPTAAGGYPVVGYTYGYFYTCYPTRDLDQAKGIETYFGYGDSTSATNPAAEAQAATAYFWDLVPLTSGQKKNLATALALKTAPVTTPTNYISPVNGATEQYTCTDT
jgi:ABC-type phosphate transport system substrate-binding protein